MVKLMYFHRRRTHLSVADYHEHWLEHHVPRFGHIAMQARRYVLYLRVECEVDVVQSDSYDGVSVVWFDDLSRARALIDSRTVIDALSDEKRFIDHDRSVAVLANEEIAIEPDGWAPIVLFRCTLSGAETAQDAVEMRRQVGREEAREAYGEGRCQGYIQNIVIHEATGPERYNDLGSNAENWDMIEAFFFDSLVIARPFLRESRAREERDSLPSRRTLWMISRRRVMKDVAR